MISIVDDEDDPIATWEALLLPDWEWEAYEKEDDGRYFGRVKSPNTYGHWEWGYFTQEQLEKAGAYRTDNQIDEDAEPFPDGGYSVPADSKLYETELDALLEDGEPDGW